MRVLDLRSPPQRWLESVWRRAGNRNTAAATGCEPGGPARSPWWNWADRLVDAIMAQRVARRHQPPERPLVVSVGNLALGGTGKTPVVVALAMDLAERGYRGAVLTRGYRSSLAGPVRVEADNVLAGDEARLMARSLAHQDWPVVQARRRRLGLDHIRDRWTDRDIVLVEDGHQTADLGRHLDVLLLDAWTISGSGPGAEVVPLTGRVFPLGPYRESSRGAGRAAIWLVEADTAPPARGSGGAQVTSFRRDSALVRTAGEPGRKVAPEEIAGPVAVLSGIAQPAAFEAGLRRRLPNEPVLAIRCSDHVDYGPSLVARIDRALADSPAATLITTAKDWIKLAPFWRSDVEVLVAELEIVWGDGKTLPQLVEERLDSVPAGEP